jgi:hypothetical protein
MNCQAPELSHGNYHMAKNSDLMKGIAKACRAADAPDISLSKD